MPEALIAVPLAGERKAMRLIDARQIPLPLAGRG